MAGKETVFLVDPNGGLHECDVATFLLLGEQLAIVWDARPPEAFANWYRRLGLTDAQVAACIDVATHPEGKWLSEKYGVVAALLLLTLRPSDRADLLARTDVASLDLATLAALVNGPIAS